MSNKRRNRRTAKGARQGIFGKARAQMKLAANITEEEDWYLDTPDVRLTKIFTVVLLLHLIAVGGILAFKMVDKASDTSAVKISSARQTFESAVQEARDLAVAVPGSGTGPATAAVPNEAPARHAPPAPLRFDPAKGDQYKVQAGDTLPEIAKSLGVSPAALREKNAIISDNELYPGRWLMIPGKNETSSSPSSAGTALVASPVPAPAPAAVSTGRPSHYEVKPGDTPWAISRKFNIPFNQLMRENGITNAESLQIGQKLKIP